MINNRLGYMLLANSIFAGALLGIFAGYNLRGFEVSNLRNEVSNLRNEVNRTVGMRDSYRSALESRGPAGQYFIEVKSDLEGGEILRHAKVYDSFGYRFVPYFKKGGEFQGFTVIQTADGAGTTIVNPTDEANALASSRLCTDAKSETEKRVASFVCK